MKLSRNTLMFDYCWVCNGRFKTSKPPGKHNREDHHIFPRNAGGTDGPLVSLCDSDHRTLHDIAKRLHKRKTYHDLLIGRNASQQKRLVWLGTCVVKAERSTAGDANKLLLNSVKLSPEETKMIVRLQKFYDKPRSDIFRHALRRLYLTTFHK